MLFVCLVAINNLFSPLPVAAVIHGICCSPVTIKVAVAVGVLMKPMYTDYIYLFHSVFLLAVPQLRRATALAKLCVDDLKLCSEMVLRFV